jgi:hypothetical protein
MAQLGFVPRAGTRRMRVLFRGAITSPLEPSLRPRITSLSPNNGPAAGGTSVVISGVNFTGATAVVFGTNPAAAFIVVSDTQITATAPAGSGGVGVRVTTPEGTSAAVTFTYAAAPTPTVTGLAPTSGVPTGGTTVVITGTNFSNATAVHFGANAASSFTVNSATQITAVSPAGAGTVNVRVTNPDGQSAILAANQFTYASLTPTVTNLSPNTGDPEGGTSVVVTGTNFTGATAVNFGTTVLSPLALTAPTVTGVNPNSGPPAGGTNVTIDGSAFTVVPGFIVVSDTEIDVIAPPGTGTVNVSVTTPNGTSVSAPANQFTFSTPMPVVTGVNPTNGPSTGGTTVTIAGTHLLGASAVHFGTVPATSYTVNNANQITAVAPPGVAGTVNVRVTTLGGQSAVGPANQFTYSAAAGPSLSNLNPNTGAAGTSVIITGTNFTGATGVSFGGVPATSFVVNSATQITAVAPAGSGTANVTVTTGDGTSNALGFTYPGHPAYWGPFTPNTGPNAAPDTFLAMAPAMPDETLVKHLPNQIANPASGNTMTQHNIQGNFGVMWAMPMPLIAASIVNNQTLANEMMGFRTADDLIVDGVAYRVYVLRNAGPFTINGPPAGFTLTIA